MGLSKRVGRILIEDILAPNWDPSNVVGYDLSVTDPSTESYLPHGTALDEVGEQFPSVAVTRSNEPVSGESGYDFLSSGSPGQLSDGTAVATIRAEVRDGADYVGDSTTYSAVDAGRIAHLIEEEIRRVCQDNATPTAASELGTVAAYPAGEVTDDRGDVPTTRIRSVTLDYSYLRD